MHGFGIYALALAVATQPEPVDPGGELTINGSDTFAAFTDTGALSLSSSIAGTDTFATMADSGALSLASSIAGTDTFATLTDSGTLVAEYDLFILTRFADTTTTFPASPGNAVLECWGGGGGGTTATSAGGGGAYARVNAYAFTASQSLAIVVGAGGATGGGTGGTTTINTTACVAVGAVGNTGGLAASCTGDVTRSGGNGQTGAGTCIGGASPGSATDAAGTTAGGPDGAPGASSNNGTSARVPGGGGISTAAAQRAGASGLARVTAPQPAAATLPRLVNYAITRATGNTTSLALTIPSGDAGDWLVYEIACDGNPTFTLTGATLVAGSASTTVVSGAVYYFVANGSEPTSLGLSASETAAVIVKRYRNVSAISGTAANATGANADPPSHDTGSSADTTWNTVVCLDSDATTSGFVTARPTNYDESLYVPCETQIAAVALGSTWRDTNAQTENPGAWASGGANVTITYGVRR